MEDPEASIEARGSGFLNESSISDMFGGHGSVKDMSRELSAILAGREGTSYEENQLDQCVMMDAGEDKDEQGGNLADMLKDVLEEDRLDDELGRVHRFSKHILSPSDLEEQKDPTPESKTPPPVHTDDSRSKSKSGLDVHPPAGIPIKSPQSPVQGVVLEGENEPAVTRMCQGCSGHDMKTLMQAFCVLF